MILEVILKYFPELTNRQKLQFEKLQQVYSDWNSKINVISRKDIDNLYERHVLHSLAIAKLVQFKNGTKLMDLGTGGGFPGVPLAIMFPDCRFHLVDSIGKKLKVIEAVKEEIELKNIFTFHSRAEQMEYQYDFVVTRAVAPMLDLITWSKGRVLSKSQNSFRNGIIALKGGDLKEEIAALGGRNVLIKPLSDFFEEDFFKDKSIVYSALSSF